MRKSGAVAKPSTTADTRLSLKVVRETPKRGQLLKPTKANGPLSISEFAAFCEGLKMGLNITKGAKTRAAALRKLRAAFGASNLILDEMNRVATIH